MQSVGLAAEQPKMVRHDHTYIDNRIVTLPTLVDNHQLLGFSKWLQVMYQCHQYKSS